MSQELSASMNDDSRSESFRCRTPTFEMRQWSKAESVTSLELVVMASFAGAGSAKSQTRLEPEPAPAEKVGFESGQEVSRSNLVCGEIPNDRACSSTVRAGDS